MLRLTLRLSLPTAGLAACCLVIACSGITQPPAAQGKTEFTLTSGEYSKEFKDNMLAAQTKYGNKVIELTGKITVASYDEEGKPRFYLEGADPTNNSEWISCQMNERFPWNKATPGQTVTVKGRGHNAFPKQVVDCEIVKVTGDSKATKMTADEFANRADGIKVGENKGGSGYFIISGEIEKLDAAAKTTFFLKTQNKKGTVVMIHFLPEDFRRLNLSSWKPGQKIEVLGGDSSNPNQGWLVNCVPMSDPK